MKEENLELQRQLWGDNYRSFIENERVSSIEYDKHIFQFFILLITGLCYTISQFYSEYPIVSLVFVVPIVSCVATIYLVLLLYRNNLKHLSHNKQLYDSIFLFEKKENEELNNIIDALRDKNKSYQRWSWRLTNISICTIFTAFIVFYIVINLDKFQNANTLAQSNKENMSLTPFGSSTAPRPTEAIVNAIKSAGSHNSIPKPSGMPSVMPSGQPINQNANATSNATSSNQTSTAR